jgi:acyl dehydratase
MAFDFSVVGKPSQPVAFDYAWKDVVLYALGVGATAKQELDYLYEGRGPKVLPSFAVVPMGVPLFTALESTGGDFKMVVHGGQRVEMHGTLAREGRVITTTTVRGIYDMKKFAIVIVDSELKTPAGELLATCSSNIIYRESGGFGGEPDFVVEEKISLEQALLYRLNGDLNPLHADPALAASVGFNEGPILHGLCTYGYMLRHALHGGLGGDLSKIAGFGCSFRKPVWPGETLRTEGFRVEGGFALRVSSKERNEAVLGQAFVTTR